ncbi:recombination regulator RecX [Undibacterium sp. SXout7W]|uniref:recombination regulator RecX n=1 Tax=Undibacterium sp. SXout7W TaxID=3413049 RepID=UPI003BF3022B
MKPKISLKARALRYLSMREHSRLELRRKLLSYVEETDDIDSILNWLEQSQFLSSERFSDSLVHRRSSRFGNHRILAELQSHQLHEEDVNRVRQVLIGTEASRAIDVLHKKFPVAPIDQTEKLKQSRFLQQRGFSGRAIQEALRAGRLEDEALS